MGRRTRDDSMKPMTRRSLASIGILVLLALPALAALAGGPELFGQEAPAAGDRQLIDPAGTTVGTRIRVPAGYARVRVEAGSFQEFLRGQPLKPDGARVEYYDGREKNPAGVYCAVLDRPIRPGDREQCADAIIRLRAEYLFGLKRYAEISFDFVADGLPRRYVDFAGADRSYPKFLKYLDFVFDHANTVSLYGQLTPVGDASGIAIGDVFIQKERAINHVVIVVDMAVNAAGEKAFLLAQSYMPAQETQILVNPSDEAMSPWYPARFSDTLATPEWRFRPARDLRRF
jgi:hypothetical protein